MKKLSTFLITALVLNACQQPTRTNQCPEPPVTELFMSQMFLRGDNTVSYDEGSFLTLRSAVFEKLLEKGMADSIKLGVGWMSPLDAEPEWFTKEYIHSKVFRVDTMYAENPNPPHQLSMVVVKDTIDPNLLMSIRPFEKWTVDDSLILFREVLGYIPVLENIDKSTGEVRGLSPFVYVPSDTRIGKATKIATVRYRQPIVGEHFDWYRENLEGSARHKLFATIFRKVWNGTMPVYATPDIGNTLNSEQLKSKLCTSDTMYIESPEEPYDLQMTVVEECASEFYDQVVAMEFIQDVYLYENMAISIDVHWYGPVVEKTDPATGEVSGTELLYWVKN